MLSTWGTGNKKQEKVIREKHGGGRCKSVTMPKKKKKRS